MEEWVGKRTIGERIKSRNRDRLEIVNKRKKMEAEANVMACVKKQRKKRGTEADFLEDLTPANTNDLSAQVRDNKHSGLRTGFQQDKSPKESFSRVFTPPNTNDLPAQVRNKNSSGLRIESQQDKSVKESFSRVFRDLEFGKSVASSSGVRTVPELNIGVSEKFSAPPGEIWDLDLGKSVPSSSLWDVPVDQALNEVWDSDLGKSFPCSSATRDVSEKSVKEKCFAESRRVDVEALVPHLIEDISSDSESEVKMKASAKKKLFKEVGRIVESISDDQDDTGATKEEDNNAKDNRTVESLSSEDPSLSSSSTSSSSSSSSPSSSCSPSSSSSSSCSSSDDEDFNANKVVGDTDDDDVREASSPVKRVFKPGRFKRSGSCLTKPRKQETKIRKLNHPEEEVVRVTKPNSGSCLTKPRKVDRKIRTSNRREEVEDVEEERLKVARVGKPQSNALFVCTHCGKENTGTLDSQSSFNRHHALRDDIEGINNFDCAYGDSLSINSGIGPMIPSRLELENPERGKEVKTPEKLFTSRHETLCSEKAKKVQAPEKSSTSRLETFNIEKAKEVQAPEKSSIYTEKEKELQAPKMPFTSRLDALDSLKAKEIREPEIQNPDKEKYVQANNSSELRMPTVADAEVLKTSEPVDVESASSSSADESGYDSAASLKDKEDKSSNTEWRMLDGSRKHVNLFRLLVNSVWEKGPLGGEVEEGEDNLVSSPEDQSEEEDQRKYDDDGLFIVRPPPLIERFGEDEPESPPEMSEKERLYAKLWEEMAFYSNPNNLDIQLPLETESDITTDESPAARCKEGRHELCLDIEIGLKCILCGYVYTEIRNMDASEWGENNTGGRKKTDRYEEEESSNFVGKLGFEAPDKNSSDEGCVSSEGTVWDKIPGVKSQMYPHQQEGFEFIWRNLAGTIMLNELENFENSDETGGCIMSHAPGTGKTRLTIIFLQAYLSCFPTCKPVIIAPASLLLTWAEEFKKWKVSIPFHNLGSLEFTGMESKAAVDLLMQKNSSARSNNEIRMVKIYSWIKSKSILGISYNLYEKLAGVKVVNKKTKTVAGKKTKTAGEVKPNRELDDIRKILMGMPGLLVLDEAHTPRNQRSCIWKTLSKVETQKRILLSGTPFQNNFQELCNVLGLARPKYLERLTATLKKSGMTVTKRGKKALVQEINNRGIEELKTVMLPFVHVHKGSILQKSLPGLRECVVVLNPPELQKRVLESIEVTHNRKIKNVFETEHKLSLVSVHPSLVSRCKLTEKERLSIDEALLEQLRKVRLDSNQSVKTRFLMEFITLCEVIKEKVLVFSQYIDPLKLIKKHLVSRFNWKEDVEVLYMHGKLEQKQRQALINEFNDPKSKAKVLLASTKACSEGINLVGASRVVLLDVVWNPAVERQAISRAYRIGQQRIVYTYHLVAKGTPEGPKYCKQAHKDRISELVFACSKQEKVAEAVIEDKVLDAMVQHRKLGDMFNNLIIQPKEADLVDGFSILMP